MPRGVKTSRSVNKAPKRELILKDDQQCYGTVTKLLGNMRMMVLLDDGSTDKNECLCTVRGSMRKREWVNVHDVVLVAFREFGDHHDIIRRYTPDEVAYLRKIQELTTVNADADAEDDDIVFEDDVEAI